MKNKLCFKLVITSSILLAALLFSFKSSLNSNEIKTLSKVWRHRGGDPENNISAIKLSIKEGYAGVEVDVFEQEGILLIGHTKKIAYKNNEKLELALKASSDLINFWIDLKGGFSFSSAKALAKIFESNKIKEHSFIETKSLSMAILLRIKGLPVTLWYQEKDNSLKNIVYRPLFNIAISLFEINRISTNKENLLKVKELYPDRRILSFTYDEENLLEKNCLENVHILLSSLSFDKIPKACHR